jgi:hypothetical protein
MDITIYTTLKMVYEDKNEELPSIDRIHLIEEQEDDDGNPIFISLTHG